MATKDWTDDFVSDKPTVKLVTPFDIMGEKLDAALNAAKQSGCGHEVFTRIRERKAALDLLRPLLLNTRFQTAMAAARSCYSGDLIKHADVLLPEDLEMLGISSDPVYDFGPMKKKMDEQAKTLESIASGTWQARHHTPYMHDNLVFRLDNISRQIIWSLFHADPFYNSEQVSQRYKKMVVEKVIRPALDPEQDKLYKDAIGFAFKLYDDFRGDLLYDAAYEAYRGRFPNKDEKDVKAAVLKKTQEVARYFLPIGTHAHMYHSINVAKLARLWRTVEGSDVPAEARHVVGMMMDELKRQDPRLAELIEGPIAKEDLLETAVATKLGPQTDKDRNDWAAHFDRGLGDNRRSRLVGYDRNAMLNVYEALCNVMGTRDAPTIIKQALSPDFNKQRADKLTLDHLQKLGRAKYGASFQFLVKLSHTADSQAQRQRMSPATRPLFERVVGGTPDYITPALVSAVGREALERYQEGMAKIWDYRNRLVDMGVPREKADYLLPNALALRYTESVDLLNFLQKDEKRECLNAQEEIGRITMEQRADVEMRFPELKGYFGPPCYLRAQAGISPPCPEGALFCGVPVWRGLEKDADGNLKNPDLAIEAQQAKRVI